MRPRTGGACVPPDLTAHSCIPYFATTVASNAGAAAADTDDGDVWLCSTIAYIAFIPIGSAPYLWLANASCIARKLRWSSLYKYTRSPIKLLKLENSACVMCSCCTKNGLRADTIMRGDSVTLRFSNSGFTRLWNKSPVEGTMLRMASFVNTLASRALPPR